MQRLWKENKMYGFQSHYIHGVKKKKSQRKEWGEYRTLAYHAVGQHATN
jgi:hypothetical protein